MGVARATAGTVPGIEPASRGAVHGWLDSGAQDENRTHDLRITSALLYP